MTYSIKGEQPFRVQSNSFTVGKTTCGYTLAFGVSKDDLMAYSEATPANEVLIVNGCTPYTWYALSGNTDENVTIIGG